MKRIGIIGMCLMAVFAFSALAASTASAKRVWTLCVEERENKGNFKDENCTEKVEKTGKWEDKIIPAGVDKEIKVVKVNVPPILTSEIEKMETVVECNTVTLKHWNAEVPSKLVANGFILNVEVEGKLTGRDLGVVVFETCKLTGLASAVCKLTAASAKEILTPPGVGVNGMSALVENTEKNKVLDNFLPEPEVNNEKSLFATIGIEGAFCPIKNGSDLVRSSFPYGELNTELEGEGGVVAKITPEGPSLTKKLGFPCAATAKVLNWKGKEINVGSFKDWAMPEANKIGKEEGPASFCGKGKVELEVEVELVPKLSFDVQ